MTEKRFELNNIVKKGHMTFWDNDGQVVINASETLDLLNDLNDENEQLKEFIKSQCPSDLYNKLLISLGNVMTNSLNK